jgi:hypothetical protein
MKYFKILAICILSILVNSCNPNNPNPTTNNWKFTVKINGITHKAEGTIIDANSNYAGINTTDPSWHLILKISDPTHSSYISGPNGYMMIEIPNPSIGVNNECSVTSDWFWDVPDANIGWDYSLTSGGTPVPNSGTVSGFYLPITISDLGSSSTSNPLPVKGSYSGTFYVPSIQNSQIPLVNFDCTVPIDLEISFEAPRV